MTLESTLIIPLILIMTFMVTGLLIAQILESKTILQANNQVVDIEPTTDLTGLEDRELTTEQTIRIGTMITHQMNYVSRHQTPVVAKRVHLLTMVYEGKEALKSWITEEVQ